MLKRTNIIALLLLVANSAYAVERDTTTIWRSKRFVGSVEHFKITEANGIWIHQEDRLSYYDDVKLVVVRLK